MDWTAALRANVDQAAARALSEQDADPYSSTAGCFDRRYWAWKLVDFPEATFQRLVLPLAIVYRDPQSRFCGRPEVLEAVKAGLACATRLQHTNGSFDQAFPFEQSYGATAFLLYPLLEAARQVEAELTAGERSAIEQTTRRAAGFLCQHGERHGIISNHLAGAALSLVVAGDRYGGPRFDAAASQLVDGLLDRQSPEGWFPEYGGADPGYQTLSLDYLSLLAEHRPSARLSLALDRAVEFLSWFVQPDNTFGGVYGSRRTSLVYLAGLARLSNRNPTAAAMCHALGGAMAKGDIAGPATMDAGNLAPLLTSTAAALPLLRPDAGDLAALPCSRHHAHQDFPAAGLSVRSGPAYFMVCGTANGGTVTVFSRPQHRLILDDAGYVGATSDDVRLTTQTTPTRTTVDATSIEVAAPFVRMPTALPTPGRFILLRIANLTLMRHVAVGNWIKRRLVNLLMRHSGDSSLRLVRRVTCDEQGVVITDRIDNPQGLRLKWMKGGQTFSSIHMASAGYFHAARLGTARPPVIVDVERLARERTIVVTNRV